MSLKKTFSHRQRGISLVEILIGLVVSSILVIGIVEIFISSKTTYNIQEGLSRLQENARFAITSISKDVRMANFLGCAQKNYNSRNILVSNSYRNILNESSDFMWDFRAGIKGFEATENTWTPALDARIADGNPTTSNDIISVKILRGSGVRLSADMVDVDDPNYGKLSVTTIGSTPPKTGDIAIITDCTTTTVFQVTDDASGVIEHKQTGDDSGITLTPGNSTSNLGYEFLKGAEIFPVETVIYYLRDSVLWRQVNEDAAQELIEGVENMQITYGLDTKGNDERADFYVTADTLENLESPPDPIRNWRRVVSVRIGLLMSTTDEVTPKREKINTATYKLNDQVITVPNDRRLRRIFTTTIALRNRTP